MAKTSRLTIFGFLWACQALIHQEFFKGWVAEENLLGYLTTLCAIVLLLRPSSSRALAALAVTSAVYNINLWPYVRNHILVENIMNLTILSAILWSWYRDRHVELTPFQRSERIFERFGPLLKYMVVIMYYFAVIAKLNWDFIDPEVSCVTMMYHEDLLEKLPFLPVAAWADQMTIWGTIVIECLLPILLTFRRTQPLGILLGLGFHLMLGVIGHRTFSGIVFALYGVFLIEHLVVRVDMLKTRFWNPKSEQFRKLAYRGAAVGVVLFVAAMIYAEASGNYAAGGLLKPYRFALLAWLTWSVLIALTYSRVILDRYRGAEGQRLNESLRPGVPALLWVVVPLVVFNGMSQYLGLKTQTCFTMYSNLRTEFYSNNHIFMPNWRLMDLQDDLVDILETNHPELQRYIEEDQRITYFEFRRFTSRETSDFRVRYVRNGKESVFTRVDGAGSDPELETKHPLLAEKLLYFRPVDKGERMSCRH